MDLGLRGKTAIVTGGASNIGHAIVRGLAAEGVGVMIADIDAAQIDRVVAEGRDAGWTVIGTRTDVSDVDSVKEMMAASIDGLGHVDILVNGAGWTIDRLFLEKPRKEWEKEVNVNLWGPINCIEAVAPHMVERKQGRIVSIGSDAGRVGEYREAVYSACKAGVAVLTKSLAREFGRYGITVNDVSPGLTLPDPATEVGELSLWHRDSPQAQLFTRPEILERAAKRYPLGRLGRPTDVVGAVLLLVSEPGSFITGQAISVNGGYSM